MTLRSQEVSASHSQHLFTRIAGSLRHHRLNWVSKLSRRLPKKYHRLQPPLHPSSLMPILLIFEAPKLQDTTQKLAGMMNPSIGQSVDKACIMASNSDGSTRSHPSGVGCVPCVVDLLTICFQFDTLDMVIWVVVSNPSNIDCTITGLAALPG